MANDNVVPIQTAANRRRREGLPVAWRPIFDDLVLQLTTIDPVPVLALADQRFGKLRIEFASSTWPADLMAAKAIARAGVTCDQCGGTGTLCRTPDGEWARRCEPHVDIPGRIEPGI